MRLVGRPRARKKWRTKSSRPTSPGAKNHPFGFGGVRPPPLSARPARSHLEELVERDRHVGRILRHHDVAPPLWAVLVPAVGLEGARARHLVDVQGDAQRLGELEARHHAGNFVEVQVPARPEAVHYLLDPRRAALRAGGDEDVVAPRGQGEPRQPPGLRLEAPEPLPERPDACGHRRVPAPLHGHRTEAKGGRRAGEDTPHPHTPPPPALTSSCRARQEGAAGWPCLCGTQSRLGGKALVCRSGRIRVRVLPFLAPGGAGEAPAPPRGPPPPPEAGPFEPLTPTSGESVWSVSGG